MRITQILNEIHYTDLYPKTFEVFRKKYNKMVRDGKAYDLYVQFSNHADNTLAKTAYADPDHSDPVGVYGYPMSYVIGWPADVWYGQKAKYLRVLKDVSKNPLHLNSLSYRECERILSRMDFKDPYSLINQAKRDYKDRFGNTGNLDAKAMFQVIQIDMDSNTDPLKRLVRSGMEQTALLRKAGFDAVVDDSKKDTHAVINAREPQQIIFLSRGAFEVVDVFTLRQNSDGQDVGTVNDQSSDKAFITKIAAAVSTAMDDRLNGEFEEHHYRLFWTKKGRRIELEILRPQSYYDKKIGQKLHKQDKLASSQYVKVTIFSEYGKVHGTMGVNDKIRDLIDSISMQFREKTEIDPNWVPENKAGYEAKVKEADHKATLARIDADQKKTIDEWVTDTSRQIKIIADHAGLSWSATDDLDPLEIYKLGNAIDSIHIKASRYYYDIQKENPEFDTKTKEGYSKIKEMLKRFDVRKLPDFEMSVEHSFWNKGTKQTIPIQFEQALDVLNFIYRSGDPEMIRRQATPFFWYIHNHELDKPKEKVSESIDLFNEYDIFKKDAKRAFVHAEKQAATDSGFRGIFLDLLSRGFNSTLDYIMQSPVYEIPPIFVQTKTNKEKTRPHGVFTALSNGNFIIKLDIPSEWAPDDAKDFLPSKLRKDEHDKMIDLWSHRIARTIVHELTHLHQWIRVNRPNLKWGQRADRHAIKKGIDWNTLSSMSSEEKAKRWPNVMHGAHNDERYLSKEDEIWGLPWNDGAVEYSSSLNGADYLTKKVEVAAHAQNVALDLMHRFDRDLVKAKSYLKDVLSSGTVPGTEDDVLHDFYTSIRKNPHVDTTQAWREFLKRVYQNMRRMSERGNVVEGVNTDLDNYAKSLPPDVAKAFASMGEEQRNKPEHAMLEVQKAMGGGVLNGVVEHVGDLTHRMTHMLTWDHYASFGEEYVIQKVKKCINVLASGYGFEREMKENIRSNASFWKIDPRVIEQRTDDALAIYAQEHAKLPVYNRAQWLAREAAVALGDKRWERSLMMLEELNAMIENGSYAKECAKFTKDANGNLVQFRPS